MNPGDIHTRMNSEHIEFSSKEELVTFAQGLLHLATLPEGHVMNWEVTLPGYRRSVPLTISVQKQEKSMEEATGIPLTECVRGRLYTFSARNFGYGVFDGGQGFIGIRTKFGEVYLDTEYHWDSGPPYGTVRSVKDTGVDCPVPDLREHLGSIDWVTSRPVEFDTLVSDGGRGWYYTDTGESSTAIRPCGVSNKELFVWLQEQE